MTAINRAAAACPAPRVTAKGRDGFLSERDFPISCGASKLAAAQFFIDDALLLASRMPPKPGVKAQKDIKLIVVRYFKCAFDNAPAQDSAAGFSEISSGLRARERTEGSRSRPGA